MTVHELVIALESLPVEMSSKEVLTEGCDCYGDAIAIKIIEIDEKKMALIQRSHGYLSALSKVDDDA